MPVIQKKITDRKLHWSLKFVKKKSNTRSLCNKNLIVNYSVSPPPFCFPSHRHYANASFNVSMV